MSDENRDPESGDAGFAIPPSVGSQLKAAREAKQLSVGDIAMTLKLGARQVEALENGDWQKLPGQTFIRGFVRNYARLLQVDAGPLMSQLDAVLESPQHRLALPEQKEPATMPQAGRPQRRDSAMVLGGLALVAVAAGVYFLWPADFSGVRARLEPVVALFSKKEPAPDATAAAPAPAPAPAAEPVFPPGTTPQQVMNPQAVGTAEGSSPAPAPTPALVPPPVLQAPATAPAAAPSEPVAAAPAQAPAPAPTPAAPAPAPAPAATQAAAPAGATGPLHFAIGQESWVEVRDRHGKILFSKRLPAGAEQDVDGEPPFSLVVGNAPGVKLSLRGQPVDLARHTQGHVARLRLE